MKKTKILATKRAHPPQYIEITHAQGRAASEPHVPGALGKYPKPNHVANKTPGDRKLGFALVLPAEIDNSSIIDV